MEAVLLARKDNWKKDFASVLAGSSIAPSRRKILPYMCGVMFMYNTAVQRLSPVVDKGKILSSCSYIVAPKQHTLSAASYIVL